MINIYRYDEENVVALTLTVNILRTLLNLNKTDNISLDDFYQLFNKFPYLRTITFPNDSEQTQQIYATNYIKRQNSPNQVLITYVKHSTNDEDYIHN